MNHPQTPKKRIPPDIFTDPMQLTIPTISQNKGKAAVNQSNQPNQGYLKLMSEYQKKQEIEKSIINITTILKTINIEIQHEQDQEISSVLCQQKEIFAQILVQKQTGQKSSLQSESAENKIISQFQNQVENLEKSVENKFNLILKSIETKSQNQFQTQSSNQISSQVSSQVSEQVFSQSSNQAKTYAQAAAIQAEENSSQTTKQKKQQEKELQKEKYREKRLII